MVETANENRETSVIVVVGRAKDFPRFGGLVRGYLFDNFTLAVADPLEEEEGIDGKIRFIGFVVGENVGELTMERQAATLNASGGILGASVYPSMATALEDAKDKFNYDTNALAVQEHAENVEEIARRFKPFGADEVEYFSTFSSLMEDGKITLIRGIMKDDVGEDEQVMVLCLATKSEDGSELKINSMAVMLTTPALRDSIELAFETFQD